MQQQKILATQTLHFSIYTSFNVRLFTHVPQATLPPKTQLLPIPTRKKKTNRACSKSASKACQQLVKHASS
jgi:hypothetical protein